MKQRKIFRKGGDFFSMWGNAKKEQMKGEKGANKEFTGLQDKILNHFFQEIEWCIDCIMCDRILAAYEVNARLHQKRSDKWGNRYLFRHYCFPFA